MARHRFAQHMLLNGIPLNYLSRWLGHGRFQTTLVYLELSPDPSAQVLPRCPGQYPRRRAGRRMAASYGG